MSGRGERRRWRAAMLGVLALLPACVSTTDELGSVAELPPLDRAVLVTGGAFLDAQALPTGTFRAVGERGVGASAETIPFDEIVAVLQRGRVFRRVVASSDAAERFAVREAFAGEGGEAVDRCLARARAEGFDLLLVVEELQDGPIDRQGTNGRWPVTFATWILLGVGAFIPDHTFESRASLRISLRELQAGRVLHELLLVPGPVELALTERTDVWGLLLSIVVPPFWVGDDEEAVALAVREHAERRLMLSMARDLKSEAVRRHIDGDMAASIVLRAGEPVRVVVTASESLTVANLIGAGITPVAVRDFELALLASRQRDGDRWRYEAPLPRSAHGLVQVLVGTLRGAVASATFAPEELRP